MSKARSHRSASRVPLLRVCIGAVLFLLVTACAPDFETAPVSKGAQAAPTSTPRPVVLPDDELPHGDSLEWWYYHGHLATESGYEYGFHFVIFQSKAPGGSFAYASQFALLDVRRGQHRFMPRAAISEREQSPGGLHLELGDDWRLDVSGERHSLYAEMDSRTSLRLTMEALPPLMLHNGSGWIGGPTGWTYYYSWPRMPAEGTLTVGGVPAKVTGEVWMDHQWGDFFVLGHPSGWQWFAIQLEDGSSLMVQEFRDTNGNPVAAYGTFAEAGATASTPLEPGTYTVETLETWTSPHTGAVYPARWRVNVPSVGLDLDIIPVAADQEITFGVPRPAIYWEGKSDVKGVLAERPVTGKAYVELTGYLKLPPLPWRVR